MKNAEKSFETTTKLPFYVNCASCTKYHLPICQKAH